ncbi:flagellar protein FlaG [Stutzerimonas nitrititolerans]|uniref:flagellar protein FlaG n=1 Tax=Stutzerimonas nitrititolerans TaxID=2482751 RepID=UPI0028ABEFD6|nr:flagellar protein FlaG [Stutzerimonas nitrititolerans]
MDIALTGGLPAHTVQVQTLPDDRRGVAGKPADSEIVDKTASVQDGSVTAESLEEAVSSIKDFVQTIRRDLNFDLDDSSGRTVVKVTDRTTGEVVRQIPTEEALRLAENLEEARSLLFKAQA